MKRYLVSLIILAIAAALGLGTFIYYYVLKPKEIRIHVPATGEAFRNPYLAAERLLTRSGIPSHSTHDLDFLPAEGQMLILANLGNTQEHYLKDRLLKWVSDGGQLMLFLPPPPETPTGFLSNIEEGFQDGAQEQLQEEDEDAPANAELAPETDEEGEPIPETSDSEAQDSPRDISDANQDKANDPSLNQESASPEQESTVEEPVSEEEQAPASTSQISRKQNYYDNPFLNYFNIESKILDTDEKLKVSWPEFGPEIELQPGERVMLKTPSDSSTFTWLCIGDREACSYLRIDHGAGQIHFLTTSTCFDNDHIGLYHHATFLTELLKQQDDPPKSLCFIYGTQLPTLWPWLMKNAWMPLFALPFALLFWVWNRAPRFGPLLPDPELRRRSLGEHLRASGFWLWNRSSHAHLLQAPRNAALHALRNHFPGFDPEQQQHLEQLALQKNLPLARIRRTLFEQEITSEQDFIQMIADIETLRRKS